MSEPISPAINSHQVSLPVESFQETDFIALFEPSGKVQGPKFRDAIRSLRLVNILNDRQLHLDKIENGIFLKIRKQSNLGENALML